MPTDALPPACAPQVQRLLEDCRNATAGLPGLDALRRVDLTADGRVIATFGGDYRIRAASLDRPDMGLTGQTRETQIDQRLFAHADVRSRGGWRLFVQGSFARSEGRNRTRPIDQSDPDLAQVFVEAPLPVAGATLRIGRQELAPGGAGWNRWLGIRDGTDLRRTFHAARLDATLAGGWRATAFEARPTVVGPGALDDEHDRRERFRGVVLDAPKTPTRETGVYLFQRERPDARYRGVAGAENRVTAGLRARFVSGADETVLQTAVQGGETAGKDVFAHALQLDYARTSGPNRLSLQAGWSSGDGDPADGKVGTFDPLYLNPIAFSEGPFVYPQNEVHVGAGAQRTLKNGWRLRGAATWVGRASTDDAIYLLNSRPAPTPSGSGRGTAVLLEAAVYKALNRRVEVGAHIVRAEALDGLKAAGGRDGLFGVLFLGYRF